MAEVYIDRIRRNRIVHERAKDRCERCGVEARAVGYWSPYGTFIPMHYGHFQPMPGVIRRVTLKLATVNDDASDTSDGNLILLCQRHYRMQLEDRKRRVRLVDRRKQAIRDGQLSFDWSET